ncbi:unnamed protein product [Periconia digitata]|uniref:Uncharacterized protein n=1 Tax=Periconia digitata TaxID=1303443 RepID=A0A9W4UMW4_9PLEO|nr:unnamed protein product [Periconia digitata]
MSPPSSRYHHLPQNPPDYTSWAIISDQPPPTYDSQLPLDEPPPSYRDATLSETAPLLVGPSWDYGTYAEADERSLTTIASDTDMEETSAAEQMGHAVVVVMFFVVMFGLWKIASNPPAFLGGFPP